MKLNEIVSYSVIIMPIIGVAAMFANSKYQYHLQKSLLLEQAAIVAGTQKSPRAQKKKGWFKRTITSTWFQFLVLGITAADLVYLCNQPGPFTKRIFLQIIFATAGLIVQWFAINQTTINETIDGLLSCQASTIEMIEKLNTLVGKSSDLSLYAADGLNRLIENPRMQEIIQPKPPPQLEVRPKPRRGTGTATADKTGV
jgi:hypothetical protein